MSAPCVPLARLIWIWPPTTRRSRTPAGSWRVRESRVTIALLYPELLGTYGDGGNATVLAERLRWRGVDADVITLGAGDTVPTSCDVYLMGGGEDGPQAL